MVTMLPLRTIQLGSYFLRIYASPLSIPDHPWASFEDLGTLAEMAGIDQGRWLAGLRQGFPDMLHDLPGGTIIIAEPLVGGLFHGWVMMGHEGAQALLDAWTTAWIAIFTEQFMHLPRPEWLKVRRMAELRSIPRVPGVTIMQ